MTLLPGPLDIQAASVGDVDVEFSGTCWWYLTRGGDLVDGADGKALLFLDFSRAHAAAERVRRGLPPSR